LPEPSSPESLAALADRWERDKSSRIFLQLAEEYRRADRPGDAIAVLADGLRHHPSSVAGLVAMGRCQIEIGEEREATQVLERALDLDPAQLVANKLLAEAWIRLGDADQARSRLATYRLFNERDSDLEELERRLEELATVDDEGSADDAESGSGDGPIFDLASSPESASLTFLGRSGGSAPAEEESRSEPFAGLFDRGEAESRIVASLSKEQIFNLPGLVDDLRESPESAAGDTPDATELSVASPEAATIAPTIAAEPAIGEPEPGESPEADSEPPAEGHQPMFSLQSIGEEVEQETLEAGSPDGSIETSDSLREPDEREASATLAALYLQQGHLDEAEAEYRSVLESRPADAAARSGLARIADLRSGLVMLAPGSRPAEPATGLSPTEGGLTQRKIAVLSRWLVQLRQARVG
jgi:tetratricopeptide (TPR) repeat protein